MKKSIFHRKGFVQLLWKLGFFGLFLLAEGYLIQSEITIPAHWWAERFVMSTDFAMSGILLTAGVFFLLARNQIVHIKQQSKFNLSRFLAMLALNILFAYLFMLLVQHMAKVSEIHAGLIVLWYILGMAMVATLFFSVFFIKDVVDFLKTPRTFIAAVIGASFAFWYHLFKGFWYGFAYIVAKVVYFLLSLSYHDVTYTMNSDYVPMIGTKAFNVLIAGPCSGINGVKLFLILFTFFLVLDWKAINPKKAVFLYFFGTVVMFTVNIIRVYLVLLMGNIINPEFAMKGFHENIGWVLFTIVFIIFEYLTYSWMRK